MNLHFESHAASDEDVARYRQQGYLIYGPLLTGTSLEAVQHEVDRLWQAHGKHFDPGAGWLANSLLNGVHRDSPLIRDILYRSPLVDAMTCMIGPNIKAASNQLTFKQRGDDSPFQWHQDNGYGTLAPDNSISCWLALDDVDERNGCLWIIPGSHRNGAIEHSSGKPGERQAQPDGADRAIPLRLRAGECVFFHASALHMSRGNQTDRMRRAYFFRYADADAIEIVTGQPRIGMLLRGKSRFTEVTDCPESICHPEAVPKPS